MPSVMIVSVPYYRVGEKNGQITIQIMGSSHSIRNETKATSKLTSEHDYIEVCPYIWEDIWCNGRKYKWNR